MKNVIKKYIERLTIDDVKRFIKINNYGINDSEINTIYKYIKNNWEDILNNKQEVLIKLKQDLTPSTYLEIMKLLNKYKKYIN